MTFYEEIYYSLNPNQKNLSELCPQVNPAILFGEEDHYYLGYPDIHPTVSMWGHNTYLTGNLKIGKETAIYPGCNFNGDAKMIMEIGDRCSLQHVELHYSGFREMNTTIGNNCFLSHLVFGHSVIMGNGCYLLGHVTILDGAVLEDYVFVDGNSTVLSNASLKLGYAYSGIISKDTKPICKTSEKVFGIDPKTGKTLYIGGDDGVWKRVNDSHILRNSNQMKLMALQHGNLENNEMANGILISHIIQAGIFSISMATRLFSKASSTLDWNLFLNSIRAIYTGTSVQSEYKMLWEGNSSIINEIIIELKNFNDEIMINIDTIDKPILVTPEFVSLLIKKITEFRDETKKFQNT